MADIWQKELKKIKKENDEIGKRNLAYLKETGSGTPMINDGIETIEYMYIDERTIRCNHLGKNDFWDIEIPEKGVIDDPDYGKWIPDNIIESQKEAVLKLLRSQFPGVRLTRSSSELTGI